MNDRVVAAPIIRAEIQGRDFEVDSLSETEAKDLTRLITDQHKD